MKSNIAIQTIVNKIVKITFVRLLEELIITGVAKTFASIYFINKAMQEIESNKKKGIFAKWIKRFGFWGFMFFFVKGMLWIIVPAVLIWLGYTWE